MPSTEFGISPASFKVLDRNAGIECDATDRRSIFEAYEDSCNERMGIRRLSIVMSPGSTAYPLGDRFTTQIPMYDAAIRRLTDGIRDDVSDDPRLVKHETDEESYWQLSRETILDGQRRDVMAFFKGGNSPQESTRVTIFIADVKRYLLVDEEGARTMVKGDFKENSHLAANESDLVFWRQVIDAFKNPIAGLRPRPLIS